ncbi:MAG: hypothetical protein NVS9B7_30340 [Flavisolibacter sp.]
MMISKNDSFEEIWVSRDYETVFCSEEEKEHYLNYLTRKEIPRGMNVVLLKKKLNRTYTKNEITSAKPEQLKAMVK